MLVSIVTYNNMLEYSIEMMILLWLSFSMQQEKVRQAKAKLKKKIVFKRMKK